LLRGAAPLSAGYSILIKKQTIKGKKSFFTHRMTGMNDYHKQTIPKLTVIVLQNKIFMVDIS
jgi:hypothetical protein